MKKIILLVILLFMSVNVYSLDNKLYFKEDKDVIYYDSKLIGEDYFMKHLSMIPGDSFTDDLIIENGTKNDYKLFFKVESLKQSQLVDELLENIYMTVYLDDELIYDGKATGVDYGNGNLKNSILIGDFVPSKVSKIKVVTKLSEEYNNIDNDEISYVDWKFYVQYTNKGNIEEKEYSFTKYKC